MAEDLRIDVLFEFREFTRPLSILPNDVCKTIAGELKDMGVEDAAVTLAGKVEKGNYLLKKWSERWNTFVDVTSFEDIKDGGKLSVKQVQSPSIKGKSRLSRVKKPSEAEAMALSKCFPSSGSKVFNPNLDYRGKKTQKCAKKPSKVEVVMLREFQGCIPKGEARKKLRKAGRVSDILFNRSMTNSQVESAIKRSFRHLDINYFAVLETDASGHFLSHSPQKLDGQGVVVSRRGALYLCEEFPSSDEESTKKEKKLKDHSSATRTVHHSTVVIDSDSSADEESLLPRVNVRSHLPQSHLPQTPLQRSLPPSPSLQKSSEEYIMESRKIRQEQDEQYAESLRIDQEKDTTKKKEEMRVEMQRKLKEKWVSEGKLDGSKGKRFTIRFPDDFRFSVKIESDKSTKILYEVAFSFGRKCVLKPFSMFSILPRKKIAVDDIIASVDSSVVIVQPDEAAIDPLDLFPDSLAVKTVCVEGGGPNEVRSEGVGSSSIAEGVGGVESAGHQDENNTGKEASEDPTAIIGHVDQKREMYMMDKLDTHQGLAREFRREYVYEDVVAAYKANIIAMLQEFPFRVKFERERALDTGGVCRDLFSSFWEDAYVRHFDGEALLIPAMHPNTEMSTFPVLGTILSHGFMVCGYLPVKIVFPIIATLFCGMDVQIPDPILVESFIDYIGSVERGVIQECILFKGSSYPPALQDKIIDVLSRFNCTDISTPLNIKRLLRELARHQLLAKPLGVLYTLHSGIPTVYHDFLKSFSVTELFDLYKALNATPSSVLKLLEEPTAINSAQSRVFGYLKTYIRGGKLDELRLFLRFVTGSSVLLAQPIVIAFNKLSGLSRRPISHTCNCMLELSINYSSFPEFELELSRILSNEMSWFMDAV